MDQGHWGQLLHAGRRAGVAGAGGMAGSAARCMGQKWGWKVEEMVGEMAQLRWYIYIYIHTHTYIYTHIWNHSYRMLYQWLILMLYHPSLCGFLSITVLTKAPPSRTSRWFAWSPKLFGGTFGWIGSEILTSSSTYRRCLRYGAESVQDHPLRITSLQVRISFLQWLAV